MKGASRYLLSTALAGSVVFVAAQAQAITLVPFATYTQVGSKTTIEWLHTGALNGSIFSTVPGKSAPGSNPVIFNFLDTSKYLNDMAAKLTLTGSETGNPATDTVEQGGIGGSFTFIYEGPTTTFMGHTYTHDVTNLLTGVYTLARIDGAGSSGSFHDSTNIGTVTFTSDIIANLPTADARDFSYSLVSITPSLSFTPGKALNTFKAGASGIFSAGFVPEPGTWAMLLLGFGGLGGLMRARRGSLAA
jgi:hypothetical protein